MPYFISVLIGGLFNAVGAFATSILIKLFVGFVIYEGLSVLTGSVTSHIWSNLDALPPTIIQILALLKVGSAINVILSAITVRKILGGLNSDSIKKMQLK